MRYESQRDTKLEEQLLGSMLYSPERVIEIADTLTAEDFYDPRNRAAFEAMVAVCRRNEPVDHITVRAQLVASGELAAAGGDERLLSLTDVVMGGASIDAAVKRLASLGNVRRVQQTAMRVLAESCEPIEDTDDFLDRAEAAFGSATQARGLDQAPVHISEVMRVALADMVKQAETGRPVGYRTGLYDYDEMLGGLVPGEVIVVAGRPGMGKSMFAQRIATGIARHEQLPVVVCSLEMLRGTWGRRIIASESRVDGQLIRNARLSGEQWSDIEAAVGRLETAPVYVHDKGAQSMLDVRRAARYIARQTKSKLGLVVIDYAQLVKPYEEHGSREQEVAAVSGDVVALAKEMRCPVMLLAQLNRNVESRADKRPQLSDLRESGAIEQDADIVTFVYRDEVYDKASPDAGTAEIIVGKNRSGPTGTVKLLCSAASTTFDNLQHYGDGGHWA